MFLIGRDNEVGLGFKKIIKTSLVDLGALADLVHADRAIAVLMDEIKSHGQKFFFGVTGSAHNSARIFASAQAP
jgi:hypothetical protein